MNSVPLTRDSVRFLLDFSPPRDLFRELAGLTNTPDTSNRSPLTRRAAANLLRERIADALANQLLALTKKSEADLARSAGSARGEVAAVPGRFRRVDRQLSAPLAEEHPPAMQPAFDGELLEIIADDESLVVKWARVTPEEATTMWDGALRSLRCVCLEEPPRPQQPRNAARRD